MSAFQGSDPQFLQASACCKHFAAYDLGAWFNDDCKQSAACTLTDSAVSRVSVGPCCFPLQTTGTAWIAITLMQLSLSRILPTRTCPPSSLVWVRFWEELHGAVCV